MKLRELMKDIPILESTADPEQEISDVVYDSRKVPPGALFVAVTGFTSDGNRFVPMSMEIGSAAIVTAKRLDVNVRYMLV